MMRTSSLANVRPAHVDLLTRVDLRRFAQGDHVRTTGRQLTPTEVAMVNDSTPDELIAAHEILQRRYELHRDGGDVA